jgi:AmmeMemoRadiSam system protein B/AmmeMemoRadiSam system protein A
VPYRHLTFQRIESVLTRARIFLAMRKLATMTAVLAALAGRGLLVAAHSNGTVRPPAVAGSFYPAGAAQLAAAVDGFVQDAIPPDPAPPIAMIVPHAGYLYSGQIAADGWRQASTTGYDTVVLLGTNHTTADLRRVAVYAGTGLRTPLGVVPIDEALTAAILNEPDTASDPAPHAREHSIEVHLPFVQRLFPKAAVVAAIVPAVEGVPVRFGRALGRLLAGKRALVVASSDLSHYPSARDASAVDRRTLEAAATLDVARFRAATEGQLVRGVSELVTCACGEAPIVAAMSAASALGATRTRVVSYANSGDLPVGDPDRVVGYGAVVFSAGTGGADTSALDRPAPSSPATPLPHADRRTLLALARGTITRYLEGGVLPLGRAASPGVERSQGAFVTLRKKGELRGCVGRMAPAGPLRRVVGAMAFAAAFQDPRFPKVQLGEMKDVEIEISLLTPFRDVASPSAIVPGRDGVLLQKGRSSAVFLPQVATEAGWGLEEMLANLCAKADLPRGCWQSGARLSTFQAEVFRENERRE